MAIRNPRDTEMHNMILNSLKNIYEKKNPQSLQAATDAKKPEIKGVYPDLIVKTGYTLVFKVETEESVNEVEAMEWKHYAETIGSFYLVVPTPLRDQAVLLIQKVKVPKVRVCTYKIADNKLSFANLP